MRVFDGPDTQERKRENPGNEAPPIISLESEALRPLLRLRSLHPRLAQSPRKSCTSCSPTASASTSELAQHPLAVPCSKRGWLKIGAARNTIRAPSARRRSRGQQNQAERKANAVRASGTVCTYSNRSERVARDRWLSGRVSSASSVRLARTAAAWARMRSYGLPKMGTPPLVQ